MLEGAGFVAALGERRQFRVHVRQHLGDGDLFGEGWKRDGNGVGNALIYVRQW